MTTLQGRGQQGQTLWDPHIGMLHPLVAKDGNDSSQLLNSSMKVYCTSELHPSERQVNVILLLPFAQGKPWGSWNPSVQITTAVTVTAPDSPPAQVSSMPNKDSGLLGLN